MSDDFFPPVTGSVSFPAVEEEILRFWKDTSAFKASLD